MSASVIPLAAPEAAHVWPNDLRRALAWVLPYLSADATRPHMHALRIEWRTADVVRLVATDGHRLAWADLAATAPRAFGATIHATSARDLARCIRRVADASGQVRLDAGGAVTYAGGAVTYAGGACKLEGVQARFPFYEHAAALALRHAGPGFTAPVREVARAIRAIDARIVSQARGALGKLGVDFEITRDAGVWRLVDADPYPDETRLRTFASREAQSEPLAGVSASVSATGSFTARFRQRYVRELVAAARGAGLNEITFQFSADPFGALRGEGFARLNAQRGAFRAVIMPIRPREGQR
jgi:hypothetical protein